MLTQLDDRLYTFAYQAPMLGGAVRFPARCTVIAMASEQLALISPGPIAPPLAEAIDQLGRVSLLIAPNAFHYLYLAAAKQRYPAAKAVVAPALRTKRPQLPHDGLLPQDLPAAFLDDVEVTAIAGAPKLDEYLFYHRPSRTLIVTDLVFNIHAAEGWLTAPLLKMFGAWGKLASSWFLRRTVRDRTAAARSLEPILARPFCRTLLAHGEPIDLNAPAALARALAWLPLNH
ncbi:MAG: DUF4336 domain-containing protein [Deltaproteobacteria bacterium]|nr:DUF4336 domain-containing protein [Deltaproteobacteria bacterium]